MELSFDLVCIRHGEATSLPEGMYDDRSRPLTSRGRQMAGTLRRKMKNPIFSWAFHSGVLRAEQTCEILLGNEEVPHVGTPSTVIPELYGSDDDPRIRLVADAYLKMKGQPLRIYHGAGCKAALEGLGVDAAEAFKRSFAELRIQEVWTPRVPRILVVSHELLIQSFLGALTDQPQLFYDEKLELCNGWFVRFRENSCFIGELQKNLPIEWSA